MRILAHDLPRVDGPVKVSGRARYTHDVRVPGMLWARVLCCPYPVARATLDLDAARAVPGVELALALEQGLLDGFTQRLGQPIAAVAASSPEAAQDGLRALAPEYELGEWAVDFAQSTAEDAVPVGDAGNVRWRQEDGDEAATLAALEQAPVRVEATYTLPVQHHVSLETHVVVVDYRGGDEATVYASTQGTFTVLPDAARILELPQNRVTVVVEHMGGGFGSKLFGLDINGSIACTLAKLCGKPIHLAFTRADEFLSSGNRSGSRQTLVGGATREGELVALHARIWKLGGLSRGSHPGQPFVYRPKVSYSDAASVLTHTDSSRPMRAPGHPQASFAMESMMDELAHGIGMDPLEFRLRNLDDEKLVSQLTRAAEAIGWESHPHRLGPPDSLPERAVGIGFGVATWGVGGTPQCQVDVRIAPDGSVTSTVGAQDIGTGTRTYLAGIVAEELGLRLDQVEARLGRSTYGMGIVSGGSQTVPSLAPAIKDAAFKARRALFAHLAELMECRAEDLVAEQGVIVDRTDRERRIDWLEACATLGAEPIEARGTFVAELAGSGVRGAQAAEVEVDTQLGGIRVRKMVCVQDCGIPLNRLATRSQIEGGMIQSLSYGLLEERVLDEEHGLALSTGLDQYLIAGAREIPELVAILDEEDEREEVIGVGEPPAIPGQSAIANAIFNACGVRLRDLPMTRDKLVLGLEEKRKGGAR
jgi:xanthine dehydrogenase YagR molybdenum-binding subunit